MQVMWITLETGPICKPMSFSISKGKEGLGGLCRIAEAFHLCQGSKEVWRRGDCPSCARCSYGRSLSTPAAHILVNREGHMRSSKH